MAQHSTGTARHSTAQHWHGSAWHSIAQHWHGTARTARRPSPTASLTFRRRRYRRFPRPGCASPGVTGSTAGQGGAGTGPAPPLGPALAAPVTQGRPYGTAAAWRRRRAPLPAARPCASSRQAPGCSPASCGGRSAPAALAVTHRARCSAARALPRQLHREQPASQAGRERAAGAGRERVHVRSVLCFISGRRSPEPGQSPQPRPGPRRAPSAPVPGGAGAVAAGSGVWAGRAALPPRLPVLPARRAAAPPPERCCPSPSKTMSTSRPGSTCSGRCRAGSGEWPRAGQNGHCRRRGRAPAEGLCRLVPRRPGRPASGSGLLALHRRLLTCGVLRAQVYPGWQDFPQPLLLPLSQSLLRLRGAALRHLE